jgi:antirestriction protein
VSELLDIIDRLDDYSLFSDVNSDEDLGHYRVHELGSCDLDRMGTLGRYFDYERYGRDIRMDSNGEFTSRGWLERV